jgi:hypothetical protein
MIVHVLDFSAFQAEMWVAQQHSVPCIFYAPAALNVTNKVNVRISTELVGYNAVLFPPFAM